MLRLLFLVWILIVLSPSLFAQKEERIRYRADSLLGTQQSGRGHKILKGNVQFRHKGTDMYCDKAFFFQKRQYIEAFGHVILDGSDGKLYGDTLYYDAHKRYAEIRGDVRYKNEVGELRTNFLDYDMLNGLGYFYKGATLRDSIQTLYSLRGYYRSKDHRSRFLDSVQLFHPRYTLYCDSLYHWSDRRVSRMFGETHIFMNDTIEIYARKGGRAYGKEGNFSFYESILRTPSYFIWGDTLSLNEEEGSYRAYGHAMLSFLGDSIRLFGREGVYEPHLNNMYMQGEAVARRIMPSDTFYLRADTLRIRGQTQSQIDTLEAFYDVRMYAKDMVSRCDSVIYLPRDSLMRMRGEPIFWIASSQMTAQEVDIHIPDNRISRIDFLGGALGVSPDTLGLFNQLRSKSIHMYFVADTLHHMDMIKNAESIYHVLEGDSALLGMNRTVSGEARIFFSRNQLERVLFKISPKGMFFPPGQITSANSRLQGFSWQEDRQPDRSVLMRYLRPYLEESPSPSLLLGAPPSRASPTFFVESLRP